MTAAGTLPLIRKPPLSAKPITAAQIREAMLARWSAPEYAIMWEVADATGARHTRFADAVIMSLWPSRGLELHGVEIKVSKHDWRRESADPKKAEAVAAYCDRWWVHTGPGVIKDVSELPQAWGWREFDGRSWTTMREAERRTEVKVCDRTFLAALLRRADTERRQSIHDAAQRMIEADKAAYEKRVADAVAWKTRDAEVALGEVKAFEEASGLKIGVFSAGADAGEIGALVKAILAAGLSRSWRGVFTLARELREQSEKLDKALDESGLPRPPEPEPLARYLKTKPRPRGTA